MMKSNAILVNVARGAVCDEEAIADAILENRLQSIITISIFIGGEIMYRELIGQIIGIIAPIMTVISYQLNTKKKVLFVLSAATVATCISYLLLGATVGFALNIVCLLRNICCFFLVRSKKDVWIWFGIFATVMGVCGIFTYEGAHSLLSIFGLIINCFFVINGNPQWLRKSILLTSTMVLIYNIIVFSVGGIANEALALISAAVGIIRFRSKKS